MYKVAIVDDEPIIVQGLSKAVDWNSWGCRVVGFAYDGLEGLELIRQERPDILISDICMPNMDGLTMIAALKSEFPDMQISILTGFRDFEYARQAIELGVTRFLLKPSKHEELRQAVEVMTAKLDELKRLNGRFMPTADISAEAEWTEESGESRADDTVLVSPASSFIVNNAIKYIKDHYKEKISLVDVADNIYVSQWHLSKLLNKHTGKNFSELLNGVRIDAAKELLKDPAYRISDITEEVGFGDVAHFSRVFKKLEGMSAGDYRQTLGND